MPWSTEPGHRRGVNPHQRARVMARDSGVCHLCGHDGSDNIDHIIGVKQWAREQREGSPHRDSNLAPAHQSECHVCGVRCHARKTNTEATQARAIVDAGKYHRREQHPGLNR